MKKKINIAIDGYSSCGKSTIAKAIAKKYNMDYIDTGSMYRAITLYCIDNKIINFNDKLDIEKLVSFLPTIDVKFQYCAKKNRSETYLNGVNVEDKIRGLEVSENVSKIAKIKEVREKLVKLQQKMGEKKNLVMDGRDIGTKVFPYAEIKFFITANVDIRAKRRYDELMKNNNHNINYQQVLENLKKRDKDDSNRSINPLKLSKDAILVDTSAVSVKDQNKFIFNHIEKIISYEN